MASLSRKYGISMAEIRKINELKNDNLRIGQTLQIARVNNEEETQSKEQKKGNTPEKKGKIRPGAKPASEKASEATTAPKRYKVRKGDSLNRIARQNGMTLDKLLDLNSMSNKDNIRPGQVILVQ